MKSFSLVIYVSNLTTGDQSVLYQPVCMVVKIERIMYYVSVSMDFYGSHTKKVHVAHTKSIQTIIMRSFFNP